MEPNTKKIVNLPGGFTCYKEYEAEALQVYQNAYNAAFDGYNYEWAQAVAALALARYLRD